MRSLTWPLVCAAALAALVAGGGPADAGPIALFDNATFVDTTSGGVSAESDNLQASLAAQGFQVQTFTGITPAALTTALTGANLLVIPELENGNLGTALTVPARQVIADFVFNGGGLILFGSSLFQPTPGPGRDADFLNLVFGFNVQQTPLSTPVGTSFLNVAAAGTEFAGGPASLPPNNATLALVTSTLPAGSLSIYADGPNSTVALIPFGAGEIIYLGWDWFNAAPIGALDGGWNNVLARSVAETTTGVIPEPSSVVLLGISAVSLAGAAWRRRKAQAA